MSRVCVGFHEVINYAGTVIFFIELVLFNKYYNKNCIDCKFHLQQLEKRIKINCTNYINNGELTPFKADNYVKITVNDNGSGISDAIIDNIIAPYFTTRCRDSIKGSGLGLATVHSIVKRHKRFITVTSSTAGDTTLTFFIPAPNNTIKPSIPDTRHSETTSLHHGSGKIPVMDNDERIRNVINQILSLMGYEG